MSFPEIRPQDVAPADARHILDFLNSAESAGAIADRIELPNEPDIGPRLAAHILERRAQLGTFTSLDQLLTVHLIGPVRFTRIVRSLVENLPRRGIDQAAFDELAAEVRSLRDAVDALRAAAAPPRVVLRAVGPPRYLGQPLTLVATVTGADGLRRPDVPVTLSAAWGRLRGSDGFSIQTGTSLTLRSAGDGTVRAELVPPTSEDLQATQQAAVEAALGRLDPAAATPQDAADGLGALVREYRFDANDDFRAGVDIYFRDFHQHLLDRVNLRDELKEWSSFDSAVVAYVQGLGDDGAPASGVDAAAALVVRFRDWLAPWLQVHVDAAGSETLLGGELKLATNLPAAGDMLTRIHQRVGEFVSLQQGLVGQLVGQKVAEAKLDTFLETDIDVLPDESKRTLFPAVDTASTTIATLGVHALGAIEQTRSDLRRHVNTQLTAGLDAALAQSATFKSLQTLVAAKVDKTTFDAAVASKVDIATLAELGKAADFSAFKTSLTTVFQVQSPGGGFIQPR